MNRRIRFIKKITSQEQPQLQKKQSTKSVRFAQSQVRFTSHKKNRPSNSILKNHRINTSGNSLKFRSSSLNSNVGLSTKEDQTCQNFSINKVIKDQYNKLYQKHSALSKFTDENFPPNINSLFSYVNRKKNKQSPIIWKRLSQIFGKRDLIIMNTDPLKSLIKASTKMCSQYFCIGLNCMKNNRELLKKIFQVCKINQKGLYCLKIFQKNLWKYIIIDDLIPVMQQTNKNGTSYIPVFLSTQISQNITQPVQIWPYLLQKAYAKYYLNYQALQLGNIFDFLQEISNQSYHQIYLSDKNINTKQILKQSNIMILGQQKYGSMISVFSPTGLSRKITYIKQQKKHYLQPQQLQNYFICLFIFGLIKYPYLGFCPVIQSKQSISIRTFQFKKPGKCAITLAQKDQRFLKGRIPPYQYSWIRVILLQKQINQGYRFIDGRYQNTKNLYLQAKLSKGIYYIVIMPQWKNKPIELILFLRTKVPTQIQRKKYEDRIIQDGCADLAQRLGTMCQITKQICSYNCIDKDLGLIIQHIYNEKIYGSIRIVRTTDGLKSQLPIYPFNKEFKGKNRLQINIKNQSHFTVVLMMRGGIDKNFFQNFDFGS